MTPKQADTQAYGCAFIALDNYIDRVHTPGSDEQRSFAASLPEDDPEAEGQTLSACYRRAHRLNRASGLDQIGIVPEYPDPPPGVLVPNPAELLASLTLAQGE